MKFEQHKKDDRTHTRYCISINNGIVTFSRRNNNTQRMGYNALSCEEYAVKFLVNKPTETSFSSYVSKL